jgi:hypothetical protein
MIRVTVELLPHGSEENKRILGVMLIANDSTGSATVGNYVGSMTTEYGQRSGHVTGFARKAQSVWSLIGAFLKLWGHTKHSPKLLRQIITSDSSQIKAIAMQAAEEAGR